MAQGYENTSIDEIARAAGVSKQTVYSHFKNKDALFRACISAKVEQYGLDLEQIPAKQSLRETLHTLGEQILMLLSDANVLSMFRVMISEAGGRPKVVKAFFDSGPETTNRNIARFLGALMGLDRERAEEATHTLFSLVKGRYFIEMLLEMRGPPDAGERHAHIARAVDQFLAIYGD